MKISFSFILFCSLLSGAASSHAVVDVGPGGPPQKETGGGRGGTEIVIVIGSPRGDTIILPGPRRPGGGGGGNGGTPERPGGPGGGGSSKEKESEKIKKCKANSESIRDQCKLGALDEYTRSLVNNCGRSSIFDKIGKAHALCLLEQEARRDANLYRCTVNHNTRLRDDCN